MSLNMHIVKFIIYVLFRDGVQRIYDRNHKKEQYRNNSACFCTVAGYI